MSPDSQGNLEVERYVGSCLISFSVRAARPRQQQVMGNSSHHQSSYNGELMYTPEGWSGPPLLLMATPRSNVNNQARCNRGYKDQQQSSYNPKFVNRHHHLLHSSSRTMDENNNSGKVLNGKTKDSSIDSMSVTSDESCGSNNSETSLPRIIKPRKRRKKDRKQLPASNAQQSDNAAASVKPAEQRVVVVQPNERTVNSVAANNNQRTVHQRANYHRPPQPVNRYYNSASDSCRYGDRHEASALCQCRCCDPSSSIWDSNSFSGNQIYHHQQQQQQRSFEDRRDVSALRRSWSDPMSYCSEEVVAPCNRDVGVIGDRGSRELRKKSSWSGTDGSTSLASTRDLQVSTEIVTSLNGHRDLEIKFYSTPEKDDDIWSYHENKLQRDFSTLLRAEE